MQIRKLHSEFNRLQKKHGDTSLCSIFGAGCIRKPRVMLVFMNPTGRNVSAQAGWKGISAPWLGTKNIWQLFHSLGLISSESFAATQEFKPEDWSLKFAKELYGELSRNRVYVTNLAKCTQVDARSLKDNVFREYLPLMRREILGVQPERIITFGNQVSSILLERQIKVSDYKGRSGEALIIRNQKFPVHPVYYPVGQGRRNLPLAIKRIRTILSKRLYKITFQHSAECWNVILYKIYRTYKTYGTYRFTRLNLAGGIVKLYWFSHGLLSKGVIYIRDFIQFLPRYIISKHFSYLIPGSISLRITIPIKR